MVSTTFQIFSIVGISLTAALGIFNLVLTIKSQRKTHRELFFTRQFDFFMQLCGSIAEMEEKFFDINMRYANNTDLIDKVNDHANDIDMLVNKNELIIPHELYSKISECVKFYLNVSSLSYKDIDKINQELKEEFLNKNTSLIMDIGDYIGLEHLSKKTES